MSEKRYFIRKSVSELKDENPDLFEVIVGSTPLFMIPSAQIKELPLKIGDEELIEVELTIKK